MPSVPDISVVIPTYNRGRQLEPLLTSLLAQDAADVHYDIVVVDNNSTDDTRQVVEAFANRDDQQRLRYVFEPRQGVSYARNTGVASTTAPVVVFLDDDGVPGAEWVREMKRAFDAHPEADCIGGRIRPRWVHPRPSWLTAPHWGPIAVQDRPEPARLNLRQAASCLLSANLGCRREAFEAVGGFSPAYPRNQDREFEMRLWRAGRQGLYLPAMDVVVDIPPARLTRRYHRRWQATTGKYHAIMRYRDTLTPEGAIVDEDPRVARILGSPRFLFREFLGHVAGYVQAAFAFDADRRFFHETRLWYYVSFFWTRWKTQVPLVTAAPAHQEPARDRAQ
jgi:glycosyltransferase involved in cell wall biosynthesis